MYLQKLKCDNCGVESDLFPENQWLHFVEVKYVESISWDHIVKTKKIEKLDPGYAKHFCRAICLIEYLSKRLGVLTEGET